MNFSLLLQISTEWFWMDRHFEEEETSQSLNRNGSPAFIYLFVKKKV